MRYNLIIFEKYYHMESYEIIIIGAGPAGLACAKKLGATNKKVLLLEQNNEIGPKVCAGGLIKNSLGDSQLPEELFEYKFKSISIDNFSKKQILNSINHIIYTIDRKELGQWQLKKILGNKNITVKTNSRATEISKNYIIINGKEKIEFKYLVGADGSTSLARRFLSVKTGGLIVGFQYIIPGQKRNKLEFFFDYKLFNLGYAWIFPHKNYASIGCCCINKLMPAKKLREGFKKWLKTNNIDVSCGKFEAFPVNFDYRGYRFGNIFLAGDAAGFASALTGGGIEQAVISGEEIAKSIIDKNYHSEKIDKIIKTKNRHTNVLRLLKFLGKFTKTGFSLCLYLLKNEYFASHITKRLFKI